MKEELNVHQRRPWQVRMRITGAIALVLFVLAGLSVVVGPRPTTAQSADSQSIELAPALRTQTSVQAPQTPPQPQTADLAGQYKIIGWNDLGMHCMNESFANLAVLPPFNNLWAQVIRQGPNPAIVTTGVTVEYRINDNTYSVGKTDFWQYAQQLFGVDLPPNVGLTGATLAGQMHSAGDQFTIEGVPLTPYRDSAPQPGPQNWYPYQLAKLIARDSVTGQVLAETTTVAPVSTEMRCDTCHSNGMQGGISTGNVETNILTLHDREESTNLMGSRPVLCASCHGSNALGTPGNPDLPNLSRAMHNRHALGAAAASPFMAATQALIDGADASAVPTTVTSEGTNDCYLCHPGQQTQCLRDVMYSKGLTCATCHGDTATVADPTRRPWIDLPRCATCHAPQFAENTGKRYRDSVGHGGLYCEACHGSPHAILPSIEPNDNIQNIALQGHAGTLSDCTVCHATVPDGPGPHSAYVVTGVVKDSVGARISGVTISDGAGHSAVTDASGYYVLEGLSAGTYTITPSKSGYTFSPASPSVTVPPSQLTINFVGSISTYVVTGVVQDSAKEGIPGVTISDEAGRSTTTSGNSGGYILEGLPAGAHTLTPSKSGYTFSPTSRLVTGPLNELGINFTGTAIDSDGDALWDVWETQGLDVDGNGTIDVNLPAMGADPKKRDIFVEVDWMAEDEGIFPHSHKPEPKAIEKIVRSFANAPGGGINLHVDIGPDSIDYVSGKPWGDLARGNRMPGHVPLMGSPTEDSVLSSQFNAIRGLNREQSDRVFHYALFAHQIVGTNFAPCTSGIAPGGADFIVSLGGYTGLGCEPGTLLSDFVGSENQQAGTFMHELGHTLGLSHSGREGNDNRFNHKPNYLSVMNYSFQHSGLIKESRPLGELEDGHFDYSRFELARLEEASLSEPDGIGEPLDQDGVKYATKRMVYYPYNCKPWLRPYEDAAPHEVIDDSKPIDWNCSLLGAIDEDRVQADINGAGGDEQVLTGFDDWSHLEFRAGNIGALGAAAPILVTPEDIMQAPVEITAEESLRIQQISEPRVQLTGVVSPGEVGTCGVVRYTVTLFNADLSVVDGVTLVAMLPEGFSYRPGTTTGATSSDPLIDGRYLTWSSFTIPEEGGTLPLAFDTTSARRAGTYNVAFSGSSSNGLVLPTGLTAPVIVTAGDCGVVALYLPIIMR